MTTTVTARESHDRQHQQPTVWLVTRDMDPGAIPCADEPTARAYAETRYLTGEHPDDVAHAELAWENEEDATGHAELHDRGQDTGWCVDREFVLRPDDVQQAAAADS